MASGAVWGIDIGQCALKALRCRVHDDGDKILAEAFDYIEYPKILSQPGSDPAQLIGDALKQFLSRNSVVGDKVAISVSGQAGLARFIKLPPVEAKKIPDIVRYEARQQIPFDLNDVVWDFQRMGGGAEEEGFALETEVGLFAMKRDAVLRALEPFVKVDIEVDVLQLMPLVLYNFLLFDQMGQLPSLEDYDPENPPESVVILSVGTDATDLVITNGYRVWQRSIPLGGSHFTKALTRELKLTFAKAEHVKRNATAAADPKAVFQAMRPVFSDLLTELQRSISYFSNLDRAAKIGRVIALGNAMKLPGLRRYLSQSLGYEIEKLDSFRGLVGPQVLGAPAFQDNLLSFAVTYGLAVQGLDKGALHTNLLPKEILVDRLVKRKKPWAVAAAALVLLGCSVSFAAYSLSLGSVAEEKWQTAENQAQQLIGEAGRLKSAVDQANNEFAETDKIGKTLVGNIDNRVRWLELLAAVNACLPSDPEGAREAEDTSLPWAKRIAQRNELHVTNLDCFRMDYAGWYANVKQFDVGAAKADSGATAPADPAASAGALVADSLVGGLADAAAGAPAASGPEPDWVVQLTGYHYHNGEMNNQGAEYVSQTLIKNLREGKVKLPVGNSGELEEVSIEELGVRSPVLINPRRIETELLPNPDAETGSADNRMGPRGMMHMNTPSASGRTASDAISVQRFDFTVQFYWEPKNPKERLAAKKAAESAAASASADAPAPVSAEQQ